ncbi:MAG: hypothetical protein COB69_07270 [Phycisphaera sp.]|nr:MAG: hypothetical protein COB69_07270 [Phycisphaera sp.]
MAKVAAARRRIGLSLFVARLGPSLLIAGIVAAGLVILVKVFAHRIGFTNVLPVVWVGVVGLPLMLGCLVAAASARRHWPTRLHAASALDDVAGTHDALGSSLAIAGRGIQSGFERLSVEQGEAAAERAVPNDVARIRFGASALYGAGCVALAGLLAAFAPMRTSEPSGPQPIVRVQTPEAVSEASEKLAEAREVIEAAASVGQASDKELEAIAELERELEDGLRDPEDAVAAAAQTLEQAADNAAERAAQERLEADAVRDRLRSIDSEQFEAVRELAEDLSAGDFESAAEKAESLLEQMRADPEQAEQIADELRELAEQIERDREIPQTDQDSTQESEESPTEEEFREQLEREGVPPEEAERLAEDYQRDQTQQQAEEESQERGQDRADELAEELRQAADRADEHPSEPEDANQEDAGDQGKQQPDADDSGQEQPQEQQGDQEQQGSDQGNEPGAEPSNQPSDTPETQPGDTQGEQQERNQDGEQNGTDQQQGEGSEEGADKTPQPGQAEGQDEGESAEPSPGGDQGQPTPGQPGAQPDGQPGDQPGGGPSQDNVGEPGGSGQEQPDQVGIPGGTGEGEGAKRGLGDVLRENAMQEQSAEDAESAAERFREQADRLTGSGLGDPLDELAQLPPNSPWDGPTEFVDARHEDAAESAQNERTIAEWFNPGNAQTGDDSIGEVGPQQAVRQAEERAQRAIEQQTVPRRHADVIKRVFDRLAKQAQAAQPAPPVVQDAEDAP